MKISYLDLNVVLTMCNNIIEPILNDECRICIIRSQHQGAHLLRELLLAHLMRLDRINTERGDLDTQRLELVILESKAADFRRANRLYYWQMT